MSFRESYIDTMQTNLRQDCTSSAVGSKITNRADKVFVSSMAFADQAVQDIGIRAWVQKFRMRRPSTGISDGCLQVPLFQEHAHPLEGKDPPTSGHPR